MRVPEGWSATNLAEIAKIKSGSTPLRSEGSRYFSDTGTPWVKTLDLNNGEIFFTDEQITNDALLETSCSIFPANTVLVAMYGGFNQIGRTGILKFPAAINQALSGLVLNPLKAHAEYILYYLNGNVNKWRRFAASSRKDPNITRDDVCHFPVILPPLPEQQKIAQILSTWDKAITTTEQLLANSQQQKKALMQQLLTGKKRLLDEDGVRFSGEWQVRKLGAISDMNSGGTPKSSVPEYFGGGIPWVSIADMTKCGKRISKTEKTLSAQGLANSSARMYPKNTILFAMYASIGECSIAEIEVCSSQAILGIRPKRELDFEYLYFYLASLKDKIKLQGQQGTQSNLNAAMVKDFKIPLPNIDEQKAIALVLTFADREIELLQTQLEALKQEKKALMQQLLTGKRRVIINH